MNDLMDDLHRIMEDDMSRVGDAVEAVAAGQVDDPLAWADTGLGPFARVEFVRRLLDDRIVTLEDVLPVWVTLWRDAYPDDTDPRLWAIWDALWRLNGHVPLTDGEPLPEGSRRLTIFRGQEQADPVGFAWTLDEAVALRFFAHGLQDQDPDDEPVVLSSRVGRRQVRGYITGRGEAEVIVEPPAHLWGYHPEQEAHDAGTAPTLVAPAGDRP